jgi:hypothetical protein
MLCRGTIAVGYKENKEHVHYVDEVQILCVVKLVVHVVTSEL